jgi:hypothetical protein
MRSIRYIVGLIVMVCITSICFSQMRTKDAMVKHIFSAFKNKDSNAYANTIPGLSVLKELMTEVFVSNVDSTDVMMEKEEIDAWTDQHVLEMRDFHSSTGQLKKVSIGTMQE